MKCSIHLAAVAACSLAVVQSADAAFVVLSASRETSVLNGGSVVQSFISSATAGSWNGDAGDVGDAFTTVANMGSNLLSSRMTFVGGSTVTQTAAANLVARTLATITFQASANETIRWSVNMNAAEFGASNAGAVSVRLVNASDGSVLLNRSRSFVGQGNVSLAAGVNYRLEISALAQTATSGDAESTFNVGFYTIPAPGAFALLGLAGVAGRRRR